MTSLRFETETCVIIDCPEQAVISLGRCDEANHQQINIDFAQLGEQGVSRLHAFIYKTDKGYVIEDFNSRNGTVLNDYHLMPLKKYRLRSHDKLILGRMALTVLIHA